MATELVDFSNELVSAADRAAASVVAIQGRRGIGTSGILWRDNLILTTAEGIRVEEGIKVLLPDSNVVTARLRGRDAGTDIAVLETDAALAKGLPRLEFASDNALRVGQMVLGVGRTAGTGPIASFGIISGVSGEWKTWRGGAINPFIRLNISVYPTLSGGAAVDATGKVIGLISTGLSRSSVLAVTAKTVHRIAGTLSDHGYVSRGFLGVVLQPVALPAELREKLKQETGIMLMGIEPGGPAATGGLIMGDVLVAAGGQPLADPEALADFLEQTPAGHIVTFHILRAGVEQDLAVRVGERPGGKRQGGGR